LSLFASAMIGNELIALGVANLYVVIYLGAACWLARTGMRYVPGFTPGHARVGIVILAAISAIVPALFESLADRPVWNSMLHVTNPSVVIYQASQNLFEVSLVITVLAAVALLMLVVNLAAMFSAVLEIVKGPPVPVASPQAPEETVLVDTQAVVPA
jgi:hypothetical protein